MAAELQDNKSESARQLTLIQNLANTKQDQINITLVDLQIAEQLSAHLAAPPMGPIISDDSQVGEVIVSLIGSDPNRLRGDVAANRCANLLQVSLHQLLCKGIVAANRALPEPRLISFLGHQTLVLLAEKILP